jgi:hypothetical protein
MRRIFSVRRAGVTPGEIVEGRVSARGAGRSAHLPVRRVARAVSLLTAVLFGAQCQRPTGPSIPDCEFNGPTISVSPGLNPTFSWSPQCAALELAVFDDTIGLAAWDIAGRITSPVSYGSWQNGNVDVITAPHPLVAGHQYSVQLYRGFVNGTALVAQQGFTP